MVSSQADLMDLKTHTIINGKNILIILLADIDANKT